VGLRKIADYTIIRELGRGGMGAVFQALSPSGATVALKTVTWPETPGARARWEAIERFQREARAARALSHPNICQVLDFGAEQDTLFIVMEFLDGQSLRELIQSAGAIRPERAVEIVSAVCEGLGQAHQHGVVHRDIKPENIMVLRRGQVKLTDFGLASVAADTATSETGRMVGTLCYLSPEQVRGEPVDARSDIFSLGATFYEMLTGKRAFQAEERGAVIRQLLTVDPPPVADLPERVSETLQRCLRKRPQARFQSVQEMLVTLTGRAPAPTTTQVLQGQQEAPRIITPTPTPSGPLPPIWNVPHRRNPNFIGRGELLAAIESTLAGEGQTALTQAIVGLGGIGKTQLALECSYRRAGDYQVVWWVHSEEPTQLAADYAALAVSLDLPEKQAPDQSVVVSATRRWLERNGDWLLVFDGAPRPQALVDYLPRGGGGHVLITSRDQNWGITATVVAVPVLPQAEAVTLLEKRTGWSGPEVAVLAEELGRLPLALEQAAAYGVARGCSVNTYLDILRSRRQALLQREEPPEGYQGTVTTTWGLAMTEAKAECPAAAGLLDLCAYFAPEKIPLSLVQEGANHLPEPLATAARDPLLLHDAVAALRRYSLVDVHQEALSVNRLVQAVVRDGLSEEEQRTWAGVAVCLVYTGFPQYGQYSADVRAWPKCASLLPHALAAAELASRLKASPVESGRLLSRVGFYLQERAGSDQGYLDRAVEVVEQALGPDHPELGERLVDAAEIGVVSSQARLERALAIAERTQGPDGPLVGWALSELARVLVVLGDPVSARAYAERSLAIAERAIRPDHPNVESVAGAHMRLGTVLAAVGDFAGQKTEYEHGLAMAEQAYGPDHLWVGYVLFLVGSAMLSLGETAKAKACHERVLAIYEKAFGPESNLIAEGMIFLARVLQDIGEPESAKALLERMLVIHEKEYGPSREGMFWLLHPLASVLLDLGDLESAARHLGQALTVGIAYRRGLGEWAGPDWEGGVAMLPAVGRLRRLQGRLAESKAHLEESLATPEQLPPPHWGRIPATHLEYGLTLQAMGDLAGAREHLEQAVAMSESQLGPKHPRTERARRCLAALDAEAA
jgi:tetratricopeptide (TPR) repeat protein/predicted Ser/Thr protein kinase